LILDDKTGDPIANNEDLPKACRRMFSKPQSMPDLQAHLAKLPNTETLRREFALDDEPPDGAYGPVSADLDYRICLSSSAERHKISGAMLDRDYNEREWNNRWHTSISEMNDCMHRLHKDYFVQRSLFDTSKSQRWRRYNYTERATGGWRPNKTKAPPRFPPLGARPAGGVGTLLF